MARPHPTPVIRAVLTLCFLLCLPTRCPAETTNTFDTLRIDGIAFSTKDEMAVEGFIVEKGPRRSSAEVVLSGIRINGKGNLDELRFHLIDGPDESASKNLKKGDWLSVKGRWGQCLDAGPQLDIGFKVTDYQRIPKAPHAFKDFADRDCELTGIAIAGGKMKLGAEWAKVEGLGEWPSALLNKKIEVQGRLQKTSTGWQWQNATWNAEALADRIGQEVVLTGTLWSLNGVWWFERKGDEERICLTSAQGPVLEFPNHHGTPIRVTGRLVRQLRPSLDQISTKVDRDLVPQYTVRDAKVQHLEPKARGWSSRWINGEPVPVRDALPALEPKMAVFSGLMGFETRSVLFRAHNHETIEQIQQDGSAKMTTFLAERMEEPGIDPTLKLLYAELLATRNDERGRQVLRKAVADASSPLFPDAAECFFGFPFLPQTHGGAKPEVAWAEEVFLTLVGNDQKKMVTCEALSSDPTEERVMTPADAVFYYSRALRWLPMMPSARLRQALVTYSLALPTTEAFGFTEINPRISVIHALCQDPAPLASKTLQEWANLIRRERASELVPLSLRFLQEGDTESFQDLGAPAMEALFNINWADEDLSPMQWKSLEKLLPDLLPKAEQKLRLQLIPRGPEPVAEMLRLLADPEWEDKSGILFALRDTKDPRVIKPLLDFLGKVKDGALPQEDNLVTCAALEHSFAAIASVGNEEALRALAGLLRMDFGRAEADYMKNDGLHRIIAAELINMTGESFGTDAEAWMKWIESRGK